MFTAADMKKYFFHPMPFMSSIFFFLGSISVPFRIMEGMGGAPCHLQIS